VADDHDPRPVTFLIALQATGPRSSSCKDPLVQRRQIPSRPFFVDRFER
jgi:hypothetical protein